MRPTRESRTVQTLMDIDINQSRPVCIYYVLVFGYQCDGVAASHRSSCAGGGGRGGEG